MDQFETASSFSQAKRVKARVCMARVVAFTCITGVAEFLQVKRAGMNFRYQH